MNDALDDDLTGVDLALPSSFSRAPEWARELYREHRALRHRTGGAVMAVNAMTEKMGCEPDADGKGGKGLIGDVRKMNRDLSQLMNLKTMGVGFIGAVTIFGALILLGVAHWIQSLMPAGK